MVCRMSLHVPYWLNSVFKLSFLTLLQRKLSTHPDVLICSLRGVVGLACASTIFNLDQSLLPTPKHDSSETRNNTAFFPNPKINPPAILGIMLWLKSCLHLVLALWGGQKIKPLIAVGVGLRCLKYFTSWPQGKQFPDIVCFEAWFPGWRWWDRVGRSGWKDLEVIEGNWNLTFWWEPSPECFLMACCCGPMP